MPIRLTIVDGQTLTRYGLRELVSRYPDIEIVAECQSAAEARDVVAAATPDVVTIDVVLPDGDGLELARELRDRYADLGIVILTSLHEDDVLFRALENGASAFVAKSAPLTEVLSAIRHAAVAASSFTASGLATAVARRRSMQDRLALSPRETEVLRLLHDGLSVPAIADGNVHQRVHREDVRGAALRETGRGEPGPGAHDRDASRPDPVSAGPGSARCGQLRPQRAATCCAARRRRPSLALVDRDLG